MKKSIFHYALSSLLVGGIALSVTSCADDDINPNQGNDGDALVRFSINDVQEQAVNRGLEMTRGAIANGITTADLTGHKLTAHSNRNIDVCFIETTVEGVNPIKADAHTRANIATAISGDFSSTGIRGAASILTTPEWFHAEKTKSNGELYNPIRWSIAQPNARFFAVYPSKEKYSSMTINNTTTAGSPNVDFTVKSNVADQVDLMTACTGDVHYATQGEHPTTNLNFRHALTAIRFAVGQNLSWNKTIDKVEIRNAVMASKYTLSQRLDGVGADWDHSTDTHGTATLSGVSVSTSQNPNVTIMGTTGDNYTFYMIPQELTGKGVSVYVHCTDGTTITAPLKGEWKAGTTRTYKLSQTNSNWNYVLTSTNPANAVAYDQETSGPYTITSYRENNGTRQAVPWKVVGYDANDDGNFSMAEKPAWLTSLSKESGDGAPYSAETGTASLKKAEMIDLLKPRNDGLKNATPLGTAAAPYDLSTKGGSVARNTANCYVISAPGHYRIPLVYGNAIENGVTNSRAYISSAPVTLYIGDDMIVHNFKDHMGKDITDPWIEKTNSSAYANIDGAKIVWSDEKDLVTSPSVVHVGGDAYLDFEVKQSDIKSGNAVVAVTKGGTVVWSWHLWFAPQSALTPIPVTNYQNVIYNFTTETLGWKPTKWEKTTYTTPRAVKVKIEQTVANNNVKQQTVINIIQNPGNIKKFAVALYQWGRKDAFPGTNDIKIGSIDGNAGDGMDFIRCIREPDKIFNEYGWFGYRYYRGYNVWSADNTSIEYNDNAVIKTVYDPSPVGFKVPASRAFSGFSTDGTTFGHVNLVDTGDEQTFRDNGGHNFWTDNNKNAIIYFPAPGGWGRLSVGSVGSAGIYWTAIPSNNTGTSAYSLSIYGTTVSIRDLHNRPQTGAVRPVSE